MVTTHIENCVFTNKILLQQELYISYRWENVNWKYELLLQFM